MSDGLVQSAPLLTSSSPKVPQLEKAKTPAQLEKAAREFESMFMSIVTKSMRATVQESGLFEDTKHIETYQQLLDDEYAKMSASKGNGTGIAELLIKQMTQKGAK